MQVHLDPAGGGEHVLPPVLHAPALDEGHADGAHAGQGVHRLEALVDPLGEEGGELLVVENLETATRRDLAHLRQICLKLGNVLNCEIRELH